MQQSFENGDTNGDHRRNVSDVVRLLRYLFLNGPAVVPACSCPVPSPCEEGEAPERCVPFSFEESVCTAELLDCDEIEQIYNFLVRELGAYCGLDAACHFVPGHCHVGLGDGCYYSLNTKVASQDLSRRFEELGCFDPKELICDCPAPPPIVLRRDGKAYEAHGNVDRLADEADSLDQEMIVRDPHVPVTEVLQVFQNEKLRFFCRQVLRRDTALDDTSSDMIRRR